MDINFPIILGFDTVGAVNAINFDLELTSTTITWARIGVYYSPVGSGSWTQAQVWDAGAADASVYDAASDSYVNVPSSPVGWAMRTFLISGLVPGLYRVGIICLGSSGGVVDSDNLMIDNMYFDNASVPGKFTIRADRVNPLHVVTRTIELRGLPEDQYDFRIWRTTADQTAVTWQDDIYMRGYAEIINRKLTYPNHALMGIRAMATDRLYGGRPRITSVAIGEPLSVPAAADRYSTTLATIEPVITSTALVNGVSVVGMRAVVIPITLPAPDGKYFWMVFTNSPGMAQENRLLTKYMVRIQTWAPSGGSTRLYIETSENFIATTPVMLFHEDKAPTRNTAWAVAKILIAGSHGRITENSIDWDAFSAWNDWNMTLKNGVPRHLFDAVIDFNTDLWSLAMRIAVTARGNLIKKGNKYSVWIDRAATPRQLFGEGNSSNFTLSPIPRADRANILTSSYLEEASQYEQTDISREDVQGDEYPIVKSLPVMVGITREAHMISIMDHMLLQNRYIGSMCGFDAGIDSIEVTIGDVFICQSQAKDFAISGRLGSVRNGICQLDQEFTPEAGATYTLTIWAKDGNSYSTTIIAANTTPFSSVAQPPLLPPESDSYEYPFVMSKVTEERMLFRCIGLKRNADTLEASIAGIEYRSECYVND